MLAEYLQNAEYAEVLSSDIMSGVQVFRFSVSPPSDALPAALPLQLKPLHFEAFFCTGGALMLSRRHGQPVTVSAQEIFLLSDLSFITSACITMPLKGYLVETDGLNARETLKTLCLLLGNLKLYTTQVRYLMEQRKGCTLLRSTPWSRAAFSLLDSLSPEEQPRYCLLKTVELLYLLCTRSSLIENEMERDLPDSSLNRTITDMQTYMEQHLDEKLTIDVMCRLFHISPTAFKSHFRRIYGQPVHAWFQSFRIQRAAELLHSSSLTILQIAQSVGYDGVSQFNVLFKRHFGVTPRQYRKMSDTGEF